MKRANALIVVGLLSALLVGCAAGPPVKSLADGRTGKVYFESTSPYVFSEVFDGSHKSKKITVFGTLVMPPKIQGRVPAVVMVHSSGGVRHWRHFGYYAPALNKMGVAAFVIDSFTPRGISRSVGQQWLVTAEMMTADAFHALKLLSTHPQIDKNRIAVVGWSKGGGVAIRTAFEKVRRAMLPGDLKFAAHVTFYPACMVQFETIEMTGAPMLMLLGEKDDWTPAFWCLRYAKRMQQTGQDVRIVIYPGAHHAWDQNPEKPVRTVRAARRFGECYMEILDDGKVVERTTGLPINTPEQRKKAYKACAKKLGPTVGWDDEAAEKSMEDMKAFLRRVFFGG